MARAATSAALALLLLHGCSALSLSLRGAADQAPDPKEEAEMPPEAKLDCADAERGDQCWKAVKWSHFSGIKKHPEWYPNLTMESSFKEIQTDLARRGKATCKMPCPLKAPEPMNVAEMNVDQLNRYLNNEWDGVVTTTQDPKKWLEEWEYDRPTSTTAAPAKEEVESTSAAPAEEQNATDAAPAEQNATNAAPTEQANATTDEGASPEASANASSSPDAMEAAPVEGEEDTKAISAEVQELEDKVMKAKKWLDDAATEADEKKNAGATEADGKKEALVAPATPTENAYGDNLDMKEASEDEWATESNATAAENAAEAIPARESEDASDAVNSSEAEREALEADRLQERQEMVLDGSPSYPGCFVRLPDGCPNHYRKSHLWRHDVWAEQGKNISDSGCKLRRKYWNEFCGIDNAKVLYVAPPEGEGERQSEEDYANEEKKGWIIDGYPLHHGCYMRMPSGCANHFKKSHLWRHDVWAEERNVNASQCGERRGFWNNFCGVSDAKVVFKDLPMHESSAEDEENATATRESSEQADSGAVRGVDQELLPMVDDSGADVNSSADSTYPSDEEANATDRLDSNATADQEANATVEENATASEATKETATAEEASNATAAAEEAPQENATAEAPLEEKNTVEEAKVEETTTTVQIVNAEPLPEVDMEALNMTEEAEAAAQNKQETEAELKEQLLHEMRKQMGITESTTTAPAILETVQQQAKADIEAQMRQELLEKLRREEEGTTTADPKAELEAQIRQEMLEKIRAEATTTAAPVMSRAEIEAQMRDEIIHQLHAEEVRTTATTTPMETREEMTIRIKAELMQKMREEEAAKAEKEEMVAKVREELAKEQATTTQAAETAAEMEARLKAQMRAEMQQEASASAAAATSLDDLVASTTALAESAAEMEARIKADLMASLHKEEAAATTAAPQEETREEMVARIKAQIKAEISS